MGRRAAQGSGGAARGEEGDDGQNCVVMVLEATETETERAGCTLEPVENQSFVFACAGARASLIGTKPSGRCAVAPVPVCSCARLQLQCFCNGSLCLVRVLRTERLLGAAPKLRFAPARGAAQGSARVETSLGLEVLLHDTCYHVASKGSSGCEHVCCLPPVLTVLPRVVLVARDTIHGQDR